MTILTLAVLTVGMVSAHGWAHLGVCMLLGAIAYPPRDQNDESGREAETAPPLSEDGFRRILIVGSGDVAKTLAKSLKESGQGCVVGFVDDEPFDDSPYPYLGRRHSILDVIKTHRVDEVILAYAPTWQQQLMESVSANPTELSVRVVPTLYESLLCPVKLKTHHDIALVPLAPHIPLWRENIKRLLDILFTTILLILTSPIYLAAALLIRVTSRGPIIFSQERIGKNGKPFHVLKFRTMVRNAEEATGPVLSSGKKDPRLTGVGRWLRAFRIDELPQLWNVLRGEMSLVGPRPERSEFVAVYESEIPAYALRHKVKPGITGLAQVHGGYHTDARDKLRYDLIYVSNYSLSLDLHILLKTVMVVLGVNGF